MPSIELKQVYKHGSRELSSGDFIIQFHIDQSQADQLLPLYLIKQDKPLNLVISDGHEETQEEKDRKEFRKKMYARIQIHSDTIGYSEDAMRTAFKNLTGKTSRTQMTDEQLEEVEKNFYREANPIGDME